MKQSTIDGQTLFKGRRLNKRPRLELITIAANLTRVLSHAEDGMVERDKRIETLERSNSDWVKTVAEREAVIRKGAQAMMEKESSLRAAIRDKDAATRDCTAAENEVLELHNKIIECQIGRVICSVIVVVITAIAASFFAPANTWILWLWSHL